MQIWPFLAFSDDPPTKEEIQELRDDLTARFGHKLGRPVSDIARVLSTGERVLQLDPLDGIRYQSSDGRHMSHGSGGRDGAYNEAVITASRLFFVTSLGWLSFNLSDLADPSPVQKSRFTVEDKQGSQVRLQFGTALGPWSTKKERASAFRDLLAKQIREAPPIGT